MNYLQHPCSKTLHAEDVHGNNGENTLASNHLVRVIDAAVPHPLLNRDLPASELFRGDSTFLPID